MQIFTIELKELKASQGMVLTNGQAYSSVGGSVYLGINDSEENWREITVEEYEEVMEKSTVSTIAMGVGYNAALPNCAIFGPRYAIGDDEEDTCHSADENRKVEDLFKFLEILKVFVEKF
jgi:hypothetical protein